MTSHTQQLHLLNRPAGEPRESDFALVTVPVPDLESGEVLVRNTWLSVDPYMRGRMNDAPSYIAPFALNESLEGSAVGEVIESRNAELPVGTRVSHFAGLRGHAVLQGEHAMPIDVGEAPETAYLGPLGTTGLTAYAAVTRIAPVRDGDVVFVSGAAGAVGSVAGQLARRLGASRVIGSAGGTAKVRTLLEDFGYDGAIDYRTERVSDRLAELAPEGIDVFIDNVGGAQLEAGIGQMRPHGRIAMVGAVSQYNQVGSHAGPSNLYEAATKEVTLRGMLVTSHFDLMPEYLGKAIPLLADGSLRTRETVVDGIENTPAALLGVLNGANIGKMLVRAS
ncbi:NADP-dependent oxidoreductase [Agromyces laixinhei]|uniref:NADP-dependent oxidoreductase n=1 Tax=Agromyces laixinhei TaxID=2585717 RepID=UPI0011173CC8|nr:NADP-dependent oxidoreductase [Agromyces laixinhei]